MTSAKSNQTPITREELNSLIDKAADIIRTATDYKFILILLFLKRISDTWQEKYEERKRILLKDHSVKDAEEEAEKNVRDTFNLKRELLWDNVTRDIDKLPENLSNALSRIAALNEDLQGVIDKFSFIGFAAQEHKEKISQLVQLYNQFKFGKAVSSDVLGDAYEHILYKFAPNQAKEGEVYTPREVIELLISILDPKPNQSVYDPACGSGGMLIESYRHVRNCYGAEEELVLYGQEYNPDIYGLCRLNLIAHGITNVHIEYGDSLLYPRFIEDGKLKTFEIVAANPPWNQDGYSDEVLKKAEFNGRYDFALVNANSADWTWIEHMIASTKPDGRIGLIIDNGCLFRGGSEKLVRKRILTQDFIEAVILLPEKLFYNTGAPGAILIFNKNKKVNRLSKIIFINASNEVVPHSTIKRLNALSEENIHKIRNAFENFNNVPGFSKIVTQKELIKNDYSLSVSLYVMPIEEKQQIDLKGAYCELKKLDAEKDTLKEEISRIMEQLLRDD